MQKNHKLNWVACTQQHPFHLVGTSPWPLVMSMSLFSTVIGLLAYLHTYVYGIFSVLFGVFSFLTTLTCWFLDILSEAACEGYHTVAVQQNILIGMLLFIASEIMFFFGFFWAFFHFSISPSIWVGGVWPPLGIYALDPLGLPLLNTIILLSSGITVTWAHAAILFSHVWKPTFALGVTIFYGLLFTLFQLYEYNNTIFSINDSVFGSVFYMTTGFHGLHVLVGTIFLIICFAKLTEGYYTKQNHVTFLCAIWYWHFVDVVWVFLFLFVYVWGS